MLLKKLVRPAGQLLIAGLIGGLVPSFDAEGLLRRVVGGAGRGGELIELQPLDAPQSLRAGYRLPVVEVPDPPPDVVGELERITPPSMAPVCPVAVRAVIASAASGMAVIAVPGAEETIVVSAGERFDTPRGRARVVAVRAREISIELGGVTVDCEVGEQPFPAASDSGRLEAPPL